MGESIRLKTLSFLVIVAVVVPAGAPGPDPELDAKFMGQQLDTLKSLREIPPECLRGPRSPEYDPRVCGKPRLAVPPECLLGWLWPGYDPRVCVESVDKK